MFQLSVSFFVKCKQMDSPFNIFFFAFHKKNHRLTGLEQHVDRINNDRTNIFGLTIPLSKKKRGGFLGSGNRSGTQQGLK